MRRQGGGESMAVGSSIALLQERFKQLERVRERREEKDLLKLFLEGERMINNPSSPPSYDPSKLSFNRAETLNDPLSLGLNPRSRQSGFRAFHGGDSATVNTAKSGCENYDVDTSLHL